MPTERVALPEQGTAWSDIKSELTAIAENDFDWRAGRLGVYVFDPGEDVRHPIIKRDMRMLIMFTRIAPLSSQIAHPRR